MRVIMLALMASLLSACAGDPVQRQPEIQVEAVTNRFSIVMQGSYLTKEDKRALREFVYLRGNPDNLNVRVESHTKRGAKVMAQVKSLLKQMSVYPSQVLSAQTTAIGNADLTLVIESYRAVVPTCQAGRQPNVVLNRFKSSANFGCTTANALAQMIADPRDLVVGDALAPTEGRKAVSTLDSYYLSSNQPLNENSPISGVMAGSSGQ